MADELEIALITRGLALVGAVRPLRVYSSDFRDVFEGGRLGPLVKGEPGPEYWLFRDAAIAFIDTLIEPGKDVVVVEPHRIIEVTGRQVWPPTVLEDDE